MFSRRMRQAILFGTDSVGLERFLRGLQAITIILLGYPELVSLLVTEVFPSSSGLKEQVATTIPIISSLKSRINIVRRSLRLFKFAQFYTNALDLMNTPREVVIDGSLDNFLAVLYSSLMGTFGLLESITLLDLMAVDGLEVFGAEKFVQINVEAQRLWFLALCCSILRHGLRLSRILTAMPGPGAAHKQAEPIGSVDVTTVEKERTHAQDDAQKVSEDSSTIWQKTWELGWDWMTKENRDVERNMRVKAILRGLLTNMLDLILPGTAVGWLRVEYGALGVVMLCTTFTSSVDVWSKIGASMDKVKASG